MYDKIYKIRKSHQGNIFIIHICHGEVSHVQKIKVLKGNNDHDKTNFTLKIHIVTCNSLVEFLSYFCFQIAKLGYSMLISVI